MRNTKAQSSVEYLGTYAWAFLGLLVTIGALNYFGVLDPTSYIQERCASGSQIACTDTFIGVNDSTGEAFFLLVITNNYPRDIMIRSVTLTNVGENPVVMEPQHLVIGPGLSHALNHTFTSHHMNPRQKEQINFIINYQRPAAGAITHNITGSSTILITDLGLIQYCGDGILNVTNGEECDPRSNTTGVGQCAGRVCRSDCSCDPA